MFDAAEYGNGLGPIQAATFDPDDPKLMILVYAEGIRRCETADPDPRDEPPPAASAPTRIINRGAAHAAIIETGATMSDFADADADEPERLTFSAIVDLMRHRIEGPMKSGSGGGRRRTKPAKIEPSDTWAGQGVGGDAPRVKIVGLTRGERDFYERRPGEALRVLRALVGAIVRDEVERPPAGATGRQMVHAFFVYGLSEPEIRILHAIPGSARRALIAHAHEHAKHHVDKLLQAEVHGQRSLARAS